MAVVCCRWRDLIWTKVRRVDWTTPLRLGTSGIHLGWIRSRVGFICIDLCPFPFGETSMEYQLTVQAQEYGTPPLSSTTNVNILGTLASDDDLLNLRCSGDDESAFASNERRKFASGSSNHHAKVSKLRTI
jgi:hypothetical protein